MGTMSAAYMRTYRARLAMSKAEGGLLPFQRRFAEAICRDKNPPAICALSTPRAQGKSWICGRLIARSLSPDDELFEAGTENILVSSSTSQARIVLEFSRLSLGDSADYRWSMDSCVHKASRTRVRVISSDSRRALGLGASTRLIVADEPAAWGPTTGRRMWDALVTALGKRKTQILAVGTLAPAPLTGPGSWWPEFVASGSGDGRHVSLLQADPKLWESFDEVLRVNPVADINPLLKRTLEREHAEALKSERAARTFKQYRLNLPGGEAVDTQPLVTAAEWARVTARPIPACEGRPVVPYRRHEQPLRGSAWTWAGVAVGLRRLRSGHLAGSKHGRLRLVCRRWPTRNVRIKCLRAHISSWFGRAAWLSTRGAPSLMLNDCCLVSGRGRLGVSSAIHIARLS